jgi:hypothetical protein
MGGYIQALKLRRDMFPSNGSRVLCRDWEIANHIFLHCHLAKLMRCYVGLCGALRIK